MKKHHLIAIGLVLLLCVASSVNAFVVVQRADMYKLLDRIHRAEQAQRPRIAAEFVANVLNRSIYLTSKLSDMEIRDLVTSLESWFHRQTSYSVQDFANVLNSVIVIAGGAHMFVAVNDAGALQVGEPIFTGNYHWDEEISPVQGDTANDMDADDEASLVPGDQAQDIELLKAGRLYMVIDLSAGPEAPRYPVSYLNAVPEGGWTDEYKTTKLVLRRIPAGTFIMGSPEEEVGRDSDETQRKVTLTRDYYIGVFPVTQKQWERVMGRWPSHFFNWAYKETRPVEAINYFAIRENPRSGLKGLSWPHSSRVHADSFMGKLRVRTGIMSFDLPTEAQWEYACRAGTTTALNSGKNITSANWREYCPNMSMVGRYYSNHTYGHFSVFRHAGTDGGTAKVGTYAPNGWGLYDMHGNVWEWCLDWYSASYSETIDPVGAISGETRVARGGSWREPARHCRSAKRNHRTPSHRDYDSYGFRVAITMP